MKRKEKKRKEKKRKKKRKEKKRKEKKKKKGKKKKKEEKGKRKKEKCVMKWIVLSWQGQFLEPLRSARHVRHTTSPLHSDGDTTHNCELKTQKENCAPRAHPAPTAQQREGPHTKCVGLATPTNKFPLALATWLKTEKLSILCGSENIPLVNEFTHKRMLETL